MSAGKHAHNDNDNTCELAQYIKYIWGRRECQRVLVSTKVFDLDEGSGINKVTTPKPNASSGEHESLKQI